MAEFLALRIITGKLTLNQVPDKLQTQVKDILNERGFTIIEEV